ncbi:MAG: 4-(cytidine 5'-diphospho)-2-C-methyl-D-erythritol kinase [Bacteroidales bacterium]
MMIIYSRAKINLGLQVVRKRNDGFHDLKTVFYPVNLRDQIEIEPSESFQYKDIGLTVDCPIEKNLVYRTYKLLSDKYTLPSSISVSMDKRIPFGAGLGGGSSNAARTLLALNELFSLNISDADLHQHALELGSDCPFFIQSSPCIASGRGEILTPINLDLSDYHIVIVKPNETVSTAEAYRGIRAQEPEVNLHEIIQTPICQWHNTLKNDFEKHIFNLKPHIEQVKNKLYELGALYASMSGSGAAVYGIFKSHPSQIKTFFPSSYFIWNE